MGKCWMFEEIGERRIPEINEYYKLTDDVFLKCLTNSTIKGEILKKVEYNSNPLFPIMELLWRAITECMEIAGEK